MGDNVAAEEMETGTEAALPTLASAAAIGEVAETVTGAQGMPGPAETEENSGQVQEVPALVSDSDVGNGSDKETEVQEVREVMAMASLDTAEDMVPEVADTETSVMGPLTSPPPSPWRWLGHRRLEQEPVKTPALVHLELAVAGGWSVGQDMRILPSKPGNCNGWIFYTHGDGATMVLYIHPYTTTPVSSVQL